MIATEKLKHLQELYELEAKIQNYDIDRAQLQPGMPCPLCGSRHHPYVHDQYQSHLGIAEQRRNEQQQRIDRLTIESDKKSLLVNTLFNKSEAGTNQLRSYRKQYTNCSPP